jgi:uridylate kinase
MKKQNWEILSLGGSLVCPEKIDVSFLRKFRGFILKWLKRDKRFVIFVGGGKLARNFQQLAKGLGIKDQKSLDWLGIYATYLNALLVKSLFGKLAFKEIIKNPTQKIKTKKRIIIGAGWKPGRSTDYDAVLFAKNLRAERVINLTDIDYVYDKDPDKFKTAKPILKISFSEFLKLGKQKWTAGLHFPFDPKATKLAKREKIKIIIVNGRKLRNLDNIFKNGKFKGTLVF